MTITYAEIIRALNTLNRFASFKLPLKISHAIVRNISALNKEYEIYEKQLKKVIADYEQYAETDEEGNPIRVKNGFPKLEGEHEQNFLGELNDLLLTEVETERYYVPEDAFDYEDSDRYDLLTASDLMALSSVLVEEK